MRATDLPKAELLAHLRANQGTTAWALAKKIGRKGSTISSRLYKMAHVKGPAKEVWSITSPVPIRGYNPWLYYTLPLPPEILAEIL